MDYEKAYKDALKRAEAMIQIAANKDEAIDFKNTIFPELAKSEDEKINKDIIAYMRYERKSSKEEIENRFIPWLEKQGEQKHVDKAEPKFKIGDWVVFNNDHDSIYQVEKIENYEYTLRHILGGSMALSFSHRNMIRAWTIEDAKDGDVLVIESGRRSDKCLFIFKDIAGREVLEHFYYRIKDNTFSPTGSFIGYLDNVYHPATKEQCELLFSKMKEAGYEWNANKKELKKIEQNPAKWSEEDEKWIDRACMLLDELNHLETLTLAKIPHNVDEIISHIKSIKKAMKGE